MRKLSVFVVLVLVINIFANIAVFSQNSENCDTFYDVGDNFWAKDAIGWMVNQKIIKGYEDRTFRPQKEILRSEFATVLVKSLDLKQIKPSDGTFSDIQKNSWMYSFVETAKPYLTGFRIDGKDYFRPNEPAVREDMAVAVVKARSVELVPDESVLAQYEDSADISPNIKKYVITAIKNGIMVGQKTESGTWKFNPQSGLTRAETAQLLYNVVKKNLGVKVTYDGKAETDTSKNSATQDSSNVCEINPSKAPVLTAEKTNNGIKLSWTKVPGECFNYYKVVISKFNPHPAYPASGYMAYFTDTNQTGYIVNKETAYNGGDFGGHLVSGETYYFVITAVYGDCKYTSNVISMEY